jgi:hypothetical protein
MKSLKLVLASIAIFASVTAFSQTDTTGRDTTSTPKKDTAVQNFNSGNPTQNMQSTDAAGTSQLTAPVSQSLFPAPNAGRYYIAVLGSYKNAENTAVTITADETNPGKVWVEGLAPAKFYALLKAVPGTYKIPAQKQSDKSIAEGTIMYDDASKMINICLGCGYKDQSPSDALTATPSGKQKNAKTVISFSGTKADQVTAGL